MKIKVEMTTASGRGAAYALPFSIGVLSDLSAGQNLVRLRDRKFHEVKLESFDDLLKRTSPTLQVHLSINDGRGSMQTTTFPMLFNSIVDFEPEAIAQRIPEIAKFVRFKTSLVELLAAVERDYNLEDVTREIMLNPMIRSDFERVGTTALSNLPCWLQAKSRLTPERLDALTAQIADFIEQGQFFSVRVMHDPMALLRGAIENADRYVQILLGQVLGNEEFRRLEATWRSLYYLILETADLPDVRVAVLDCSKKEIMKDFNLAQQVGDSALYRNIVDKHFLILGGKPFGLLIGDYEFSHLSDDVATLQSFSSLCEEAKAVFVSCPSPATFDLLRMSELHKLRGLTKAFQSEMYGRWNVFRRSTSARYVTMIVPRFLLREPYEMLPFSLDPVEFTERDYTNPASGFVWANGAFALAVAAARSLQRTGWLGQMRGADSATPMTPSKGLPDTWAPRLRTETSLTEAHVAELLDLGFTSLCSVEGSGMMGFSALTTCYSVKSEQAVEKRKQMGSSLEAMLCFGRLVHHLKRLCQEKLSGDINSMTQLQIIDTWLKTIDFSGSPLQGEVECELRPPSAGGRLFQLGITTTCREGETLRSLTATVPIVIH